MVFNPTGHSCRPLFSFLQNQLHCLIHINTYSHKQGRGRSPSWSCPSTTPAWSRWPRSPRCNKFPFSKFEMKSRNINLGRWQMDKLRSEKRLQHRPSNWLGSSLAYILCYRVIILKTKWALLCKIMFILFFSSTKWYSWANDKSLVLCFDNYLWSGWRLPWSHMWCHFTVKLEQKKT